MSARRVKERSIDVKKANAANLKEFLSDLATRYTVIAQPLPVLAAYATANTSRRRSKRYLHDAHDLPPPIPSSGVIRLALQENGTCSNATLQGTIQALSECALQIYGVDIDAKTMRTAFQTFAETRRRRIWIRKAFLSNDVRDVARFDDVSRAATGFLVCYRASSADSKILRREPVWIEPHQSDGDFRIVMAVRGVNHPSSKPWFFDAHGILSGDHLSATMAARDNDGRLAVRQIMLAQSGLPGRQGSVLIGTILRPAGPYGFSLPCVLVRPKSAPSLNEANYADFLERALHALEPDRESDQCSLGQLPPKLREFFLNIYEPYQVPLPQREFLSWDDPVIPALAALTHTA